MLIASDRHSPADLALWSAHEEADLLHKGWRARMPSTLDAIQQFVGRAACHCAVSWGKDSVVLAHLLLGVFPDVPLVYLRQSTQNPDCPRVRDYYLRHFPGQPYHEIPVLYGAGEVSHANLAWQESIRQARERFGPPLLGIRADESSARTLSVCRFGLNTNSSCRPLARWTAGDVFSYLSQHGLPVHPVYAMLGGGRWPRERLRTASIGGTDGAHAGRREHEREYYGDVLNRLRDFTVPADRGPTA